MHADVVLKQRKQCSPPLTHTDKHYMPDFCTFEMLCCLILYINIYIFNKMYFSLQHHFC